MLRCTFALESRRVLRMILTDAIVRSPLISHYTAIKRGSYLAAQIGFTDVNKETRITQFGGMTRTRVQSAGYKGTLIMKAQIRGGRNG